MGRLIVLVLVTCASVLAQSGSGSTSIFQTIFSGRPATSGSTYPYHSPAFNNIGQVGNQIFIRSRTSAGATCTTIGVIAGLEFSYDGAVWLPFGSPGLDSVAVNLDGFGQIYFGAGLFPKIRFTISSVDISAPTCFFDAYYTGSSNSTALQSSTQFSGSLTKRISPTPTDLVPNQLLGVTIGARTSALYSCGPGRGPTAPTPAGTVQVVSSGSVGDTTYICYAYFTTAATATVQFITGTGATCTGNQTIMTPPMNVSSTAPLIMGGLLGVLLEGNGNQPICIVVTGGPVSFILAGGEK